MLRLCLHIYIRKPNEETDNFWLFLDFCVLFVFAGGSLLQRIQAEIWLLQKEIKETGKTFYPVSLVSVCATLA